MTKPRKTIAAEPVEVDIRLDWRGYWLAFLERHGGNPVPYKGVLLFADGWTYSATDYAGPEWGPPASLEERQALHEAYWSERLRVVKEEHFGLVKLRESLEQAQGTHSVPLMARRLHRDENGTVRWISAPLDTAALATRIAWLAQDIAECEEKLKERSLF